MSKETDQIKCNECEHGINTDFHNYNCKLGDLSKVNLNEE